MPETPEPVELTVDHVRSGGVVTRVTRVETSAEPADARPFVLVAGVGVAATYFEFLAPRSPAGVTSTRSICPDSRE